jgi:hypothetical protein
MSLSELSFFGLTSDIASQYRINLFTQIHEIVFHGKGGYDWETIYNMPRWLRQFTFSKLTDYYTQEAESHNKNSKKPNTSTLVDSSGNVDKSAWKSITPGPKLASGSKVKYK